MSSLSGKKAPVSSTAYVAIELKLDTVDTLPLDEGQGKCCPLKTYLTLKGLQETAAKALCDFDTKKNASKYHKFLRRIQASSHMMKVWGRWLHEYGLLDKDGNATGKEVPANMCLRFFKLQRKDVKANFLAGTAKSSDPVQIGFVISGNQLLSTGAMPSITKDDGTCMLSSGCMYQCTAVTKVGGFLPVGQMNADVIEYLKSEEAKQLSINGAAPGDGGFVPSRLLGYLSSSLMPEQGSIAEMLENLSKIETLITPENFEKEPALVETFVRAVKGLCSALFAIPVKKGRKTQDGLVKGMRCGQYYMANTCTENQAPLLLDTEKAHARLSVVMEVASTNFPDAVKAFGGFKRLEAFKCYRKCTVVSDSESDESSEEEEEERAATKAKPRGKAKGKSKPEEVRGEKRKRGDDDDKDYVCSSDEDAEEGASGGKMSSVGKRRCRPEMIYPTEAISILAAKVIDVQTANRIRETLRRYLPDYDLKTAFMGGIPEVINNTMCAIHNANLPPGQPALTLHQYLNRPMTEAAKDANVYSDKPLVSAVWGIFPNGSSSLIEDAFMRVVLDALVFGVAHSREQKYFDVVVNDRWCTLMGFETGPGMNAMANAIGALSESVDAMMRTEQWRLLAWFFVSEDRTIGLVGKMGLRARIGLKNTTMWELMETLLASILMSHEVVAGRPKRASCLVEVITELIIHALHKVTRSIQEAFEHTSFYYAHLRLTPSNGIPQWPIVPRLKPSGDRFWGAVVVDPWEIPADEPAKKPAPPPFVYTEKFFGRFRLSVDHDKKDALRCMALGQCLVVKNGKIGDSAFVDDMLLCSGGFRMRYIPTRKTTLPGAASPTHMHRPGKKYALGPDSCYLSAQWISHRVQAQAQYLRRLADPEDLEPKFFVLKEEYREKVLDAIEKADIACAACLMMFMDQRFVVKVDRLYKLKEVEKPVILQVFRQKVPASSMGVWAEFLAANGANEKSLFTPLDCMACAICYDWQDGPEYANHIGYDPATGKDVIYPYVVRGLFNDKEYTDWRVTLASALVANNVISAEMSLLADGNWVGVPLEVGVIDKVMDI